MTQVEMHVVARTTCRNHFPFRVKTSLPSPAKAGGRREPSVQGGDCGWILSPRFLVTVLILVGAERQREGDETAPTSLDT